MNVIYGDVCDIEFGNRLNCILQVCNDHGRYGAGLSGALARKWPVIEREYLEWSLTEEFGIGNIQNVRVDRHLSIINMVAQRGLISQHNKHPLDYFSLEMCLIRIFGIFCQYQLKFPDGFITIYCPKIGSGLAGGDWGKIKPRIEYWFDRPEFTLNFVYLDH
jgi:hypothetical protein